MGTKNRRTIQLRNRSSSRRLRYKAEEVCRLFHSLDQSGFFTPPKGELSIVFLDDDQIAKLHKQFLNDPEPTDVITFPGDSLMDFAGEICVSVEHALFCAKEENEDFSRELTLYLVHGYLHLAGFRDATLEEQQEMRKAEAKALSYLENSDKLPKFELTENSTYAGR